MFGSATGVIPSAHRRQRRADFLSVAVSQMPTPDHYLKEVGQARNIRIFKRQNNRIIKKNNPTRKGTIFGEGDLSFLKVQVTTDGVMHRKFLGRQKKNA